MNNTAKNQVFLWVVGSCCLTLIVGFIIFVFQMNNVNTQYTQPGIADYQNGNYPKAIKELRISIQRNGTDRAAFFYLGLSLKKTGDVVRARRAFLDAKSCEARSRNPNSAYMERCDKEINDIDDGH